MKNSASEGHDVCTINVGAARRSGLACPEQP